MKETTMTPTPTGYVVVTPSYEDKLHHDVTRCKGAIVGSEVGMCPHRNECRRFKAYVNEFMSPHQKNGDAVSIEPKVVSSFIKKGEGYCERKI